MFSARTGWARAPNELSVAAEAARRDPRFVDLTLSNPTAIGIDPAPELLGLFADPRSLSYEPQPFGLASARAAVADYYRRRGVAVEPERILLCATTSEAYTFLFRLLLDRGQRAAAPTPSYPLFTFLAELSDVELVPYPVESPEEAEAEVTIVVSPNNPTGGCLTPEARAALIARARPIIADEVFLDYLIDRSRFAASTFANESAALTFTLSGLSKVAGLPQLKLSWIVVSGPSALVEEAIARLEIIADTFLSVSTPVQHALPALLAHAEEFQRSLNARLAHNRSRLPPSARVGDGGWYAILDTARDDEEVALELLDREHILVHPGYFFDMTTPAVVASLLEKEERFEDAIARAVSRLYP